MNENAENLLARIRRNKPRYHFPQVGTIDIFQCECGFMWGGDAIGSFKCPKCGKHDGDHHLTSVDSIPVFDNDFSKEA